MKNIGVILTVGITAVIVLTIGFLNFFPVSEAEPPVNGEISADPASETASAPDTAAIQAAFAARETLLQAQIAELDAEYASRQSAYDLQIEEFSTLILAGEEQLAQFDGQETILLEGFDQLQSAQAERTTAYEGQRQQAYYQYQVNIQQLQDQLDEANSKLSAAVAQLGQ